MMKKLTIFQEYTAPLEIEDWDDSDIKEYTRQISSLLENNNVSILHASTCSVVLRPNKITSIVVTEVESPAQKQQPQKKKPISSPKKMEEHEDIIHD